MTREQIESVVARQLVAEERYLRARDRSAQMSKDFLGSAAEEEARLSARKP